MRQHGWSRVVSAPSGVGLYFAPTLGCCVFRNVEALAQCCQLELLLVGVERGGAGSMSLRLPCLICQFCQFHRSLLFFPPAQ